MVDNRNLATHTYHEELADTLFDAVGGYLPVLETLYLELSERKF